MQKSIESLYKDFNEEFTREEITDLCVANRKNYPSNWVNKVKDQLKKKVKTKAEGIDNDLEKPQAEPEEVKNEKRHFDKEWTNRKL